jgi:hypothetical protein
LQDRTPPRSAAADNDAEPIIERPVVETASGEPATVVPPRADEETVQDQPPTAPASEPEATPEVPPDKPTTEPADRPQADESSADKKTSPRVEESKDTSPTVPSPKVDATDQAAAPATNPVHRRVETSLPAMVSTLSEDPPDSTAAQIVDRESVPLADDSTVQLIGGRGVDGGGSLELVERVQEGTRIWDIVQRSSSQGGTSRMVLAEVSESDGGLRFAWKGNASQKALGESLRSCILRVVTPSPSTIHDISLRRPLEVDPIPLSAQRASAGYPIPPEWRASDLRQDATYFFALLPREGTVKYPPRISPDRAVALGGQQTIRFDASNDAQVEVAFQYNQRKQGIEWNTSVTWKEKGNTIRLNSSPRLQKDVDAAFNRTDERRKKLDEQVARERLQLNARRSKEDRERTTERIADLEQDLTAARDELEALRNLRELLSLVDQDRVHFRIFMRIEEDLEIDLVRTKDAPPADMP